MDNVSEKLGLYDFFNVISVGAVFILHIVFLFPNMLSNYDNWISDGAIKFAGIFVLAYLIGIFFQELGANLENIKFFNMKRKLTTAFLINEAIIDNSVKLEQYRKYAKDILKIKGIEFSEDFTPEQNGYVYSYVEYYIEQKGRNKKFEKMRALYGMSKSLLCCMVVIMLICVVGISFGCKLYGFDITRSLWLVLYSAISILIYYFRTKRCMKYRIRMMMGIYEACVEFEKDGYTK